MTLKEFMDKYRDHKVPVKQWGKRRHNGERYKPETGQPFKDSFYYV